VLLLYSFFFFAAAGFSGVFAFVISRSVLQSGETAPGLVFGGVLSAIALVALTLWWWSNRTVGYLRIKGIPQGEAPIEIRRAWVGVEIPLRKSECMPSEHPATGILSGDATGTQFGYAVSGRVAVKILSAQNPEAAQWWRENAAHVLWWEYPMLFEASVCHQISA
jgi:hypothetical protein